MKILGRARSIVIALTLCMTAMTAVASRATADTADAKAAPASAAAVTYPGTEPGRHAREYFPAYNGDEAAMRAFFAGQSPDNTAIGCSRDQALGRGAGDDDTRSLADDHHSLAYDHREAVENPRVLGRGSAAGGGYSTVGDLLRFALGLRQHKLLDTAHSERVIGEGGGAH